MRKNLGWFILGGRKVQVSYDSKLNGAEFTAHSITIGGNYRDWPHVVGLAVHEATEKTMADMELRYEPSHDEARAMDGFLFVMNHPQFGEVAARVGAFLASVLPALSKAFKEAK